VAGTSTVAIGNLVVGVDLSGSGAIQGNLTWNDPTQAGSLSAVGLNLSINTGVFTGLVDSNYCENCFRKLADPN
jgi:hypothetical protein